MPGAGSASKPTSTSLSLRWGAAEGLPPDGGYLVLRSTSSRGPFAKDTAGTCDQTITVVTVATSCTDTGLNAGTTYYYEIEAAYYDVQTLWVSPPDVQFLGTTSKAPVSLDTPAGAPSGAPGKPSTSAPAITSAAFTTFPVGASASFQVTASGSPAPTFSNAAFGGCIPSTLPSGITLTSEGLLSSADVPDALGSYTVCINASNGESPAATQKFTLMVTSQTLVFSSPAVSGAASSTPNLGPITVRRQSGSGVPITNGTLTVNLTSTSGGATFGAAQFSPAPLSSVTILDGQSSATFWLGSTTPGNMKVTASAPAFVSATQGEVITSAPTGLGVTVAPGGTGAPVLSCAPPSVRDACTVAGVGTGGTAAVFVGFVNAPTGPAVYSTSQGATIEVTGQRSGTVTINPNASTSSPLTLKLPLGTSTLTFGPYSLTLTVSA